MFSDKKNLLFVWHIFVPLLIGAVIYIIFTENTYIARWARGVFEENAILSYWNYNDSVMGRFIRNYVCDALWAYALGMALIWYGDNVHQSVLFSSIEAIAFSCASEFLQLAGVWRGTFDIWDILVETTAVVIAAIMYMAIMLHLSNRKLRIDAKENEDEECVRV
ncbi:MAG: hypothetical protein PUC12_09360 [Clostridiales bacterium]|nr:hypothetical protein [Clostridiales bacterium]